MGKRGVSQPRENLVGQTFGFFTVREWVPFQGWRLQCVCGRFKLRPTSSGHVRKMKLLSCGRCPNRTESVKAAGVKRRKHDYAEIRRLRESGLKLKEIAKRIGVSVSRVSQILVAIKRDGTPPAGPAA